MTGPGLVVRRGADRGTAPVRRRRDRGVRLKVDPRVSAASYSSAMTGWMRLRRGVGAGGLVDFGIAAVVTVMAQVQLPGDTSVWIRLAMLVVTLALLLRSGQPMLTAVLVALGVGLMGLQPDAPSVFGEYLAVLVAAFTVAERCALPGAFAGGLLLAAGVVAHDWRSQEYGGLAGVTSDLAIPVVLWGLGRVVRLQRGRADRSGRLVTELERDRLELVRQAIAEERAHLARELHDVVTHSVSVVVIQAQGAQRVLGADHPEVGAALQTIEASGRSALTDMRRLLGLLRSDEDSAIRQPQPTLTDVPALVNRVGEAGLAVHLLLEGGSEELDSIDAGISLSAYRVVQEALTNTLKHTGATAASVEIRRHDGSLEVTVVDHGGSSGHAHQPQVGAGRGLVGMRERVALYGGTLEAEPQPVSGFRVRATFPLQEQS
jgi:signal transduction histidine kinase